MSLSRLGDRMLELFVRRGDAGASSVSVCRPNMGDTCYVTRNTCIGSMLYAIRYRGTIGCEGWCGNQQPISREPIGKC